MNPLKTIVAGIAVSLLVPSGAYTGESTDGPGAAQSQCVQCHADLKKLIRLCWEVEKVKPRPKKSSEISGEG